MKHTARTLGLLLCRLTFWVRDTRALPCILVMALCELRPLVLEEPNPGLGLGGEGVGLALPRYHWAFRGAFGGIASSPASSGSSLARFSRIDGELSDVLDGELSAFLAFNLGKIIGQSHLQ